MSQDAELFARWQLAATGAEKTPFQTQDLLLRRVGALMGSAEFQGLARDFYATKLAKYDLRLHAWCAGGDGITLTGVVLEAMAPCEVVEMELSEEAAICHPTFGRPDQEMIFRAFLRKVTEFGAEMVAADAAAAKRSAIASKYAPEPERVLAPTVERLSPRYRSLDEASRRVFWTLFKTRETDTPWSYFFYNLVLGLDWSAEQMSEAEAAELLLAPTPAPGKE